MTKPNTRTIVALAVAAVLVVIVAVAAVVTVAVRNAKTPDPALTAYAHGKTVTVAPYRYCTVAGVAQSGQLSLQCRENDVTVPLDVPGGYPLQLSLPPKIANAPWIMLAEYLLPDHRTVVRATRTYRDYPAGTLAVTVPSRPDLRLIGVEMQLVVPARDETGREFFEPYQAWSIKTA
ncbi:DUF2771 domain-containing protein [Nocardia sp. NEAU-G5]|uniref:DUF2771 domain-containing protein n=1 Tax=Nocardia albiluteola TaxID=2842303 RepID=A0ABS6AT98_9NOCA|nr:DUF2771 domain-containing protein [Nocardia albiluteola]MBU3061262.1 DUF2771 domain-containing protein [Nocardia albiluteola]